MKTVSVHDLPLQLAQGVALGLKGEEVRVLPVSPKTTSQPSLSFDWTKSIALTMDHSQMQAMTSEETLDMIHAAQGE